MHHSTGLDILPKGFSSAYGIVHSEDGGEGMENFLDSRIPLDVTTMDRAVGSQAALKETPQQRRKRKRELYRMLNMV